MRTSYSAVVGGAKTSIRDQADTVVVLRDSGAALFLDGKRVETICGTNYGAGNYTDFDALPKGCETLGQCLIRPQSRD